jgi:hypothetical protein
MQYDTHMEPGLIEAVRRFFEAANEDQAWFDFARELSALDWSHDPEDYYVVLDCCRHDKAEGLTADQCLADL